MSGRITVDAGAAARAVARAERGVTVRAVATSAGIIDAVRTRRDGADGL